MNLQGFLILVAYQLLGEAISSVLGIGIPGPVIGLLLLFVSLIILGRVPDTLETASQRMIALLPMLLITTSAGLFFLGSDFNDQWPAFLAAVIGGTVVTLLFSALLMKFLMRGSRHD